MASRTLLGVGLLLTVLVLSACGGGGGSTQSTASESGETADSGGASESALNGATIVNNQYTQEVQFFRDRSEGMSARAAELGATVENEYGDGTPEKQIEQVQNALIKHPTAITVSPIDAESILPVLAQAKEQEVPAFAVGTDVADPEAVETYIGPDNTKFGEDKAKYVVEHLHGKGEVGIIHGIHGLLFSQEQAEGFENVFSKQPGITVVDGGYAGGFSSDLGIERTENLLTSHPNLNAIIYDADDLALGGIQALRQAHIEPDQMIVASSDGSKAGLAAVKSGEIDIDISECGYSTGYIAINTIEKFLEGKPLPPKVISKTVAYTTENIDELSKKPRTFC